MSKHLTIEQELSELKRLSKILFDLLDKPEYGLTSWWTMVVDTTRRISEIAKEEERK